MKTLMQVICIFLLCLQWSSAQLFEKDDKQSDQNNSRQITNGSQQQSLKPAIQDGPVDPKEYIVGPGDIFSANIWAATSLTFQIPVTPEGSVIIPTIGEVQISGMTLESAKKKVLYEIKKKYISGTVSFTLFHPRSFMVTVIGSVFNEGSLVVQSTQRVGDAVDIANEVRVAKDQNFASNGQHQKNAEIQKKVLPSSKRKIRIVHKDGSASSADVEKFLATQNSQYNPLLLDGDVIFVSPLVLTEDFIGIYGAVLREGEYEFVEGDSLSTAIRIAGGVTPSADLDKITISRTAADGIQSLIDVNFAKIDAKENSDIVLQRGDRIIVGRKSYPIYGGIVTVEGEVMKPGAFAILHDSTRLSEIITQAGGFTKTASINSARIIRKAFKSDINETGFFISRKGFTTTEDLTYMDVEMSLKNEFELTSADFVGLFLKNDTSKDVLLHDGDKIVIPSTLNAVYVFGEVIHPGYVPYFSGKNLNYYVEAAGGKTDYAASSDIRVIKASTRQWLDPSETEIQEGDYIWIPKQPYRTFSYYLDVYSKVFGIVGTVVTLYLLIRQY